MMTRILLLTAAFCVTAPAWSAAPAPSGDAQPAGPVELYNALDEAASRAQAVFGPDETCARNLDSPPVVVPVVSESGLTGYAYVAPRICLNRNVRFDHLSNIHFLTDRFLRAGHRAPFELQADGTINREAAREAMLSAIAEFIDPASIDRLDLLGEDIRYLR